MSASSGPPGSCFTHELARMPCYEYCNMIVTVHSEYCATIR